MKQTGLTTAREYRNETKEGSYTYPVITPAMDHVNNDRVNAAYRRSDLFERCRTIPQRGGSISLITAHILAQVRAGLIYYIWL